MMTSLNRNPLSQNWQIFWACVGVPWLLITLVGLGYRMIPRESTDPRFRANDLMQDWLSAKSYLDGHSIYESLDETVPRYLFLENSHAPNSIHINGHPPTAVWMLLPLGHLSFGVATVVWNALSLLAVALALAGIISRRGLALDRSYIWPLVVLVFCSAPLLSQTTRAQFNAVLLLLLVGAWLAQRNEANWWAGVLIGIAAGLKLFPLFFLFIFLLQRDWKAFAGVVLSFAALVLISIAAFGMESWQLFVSDVMPSLREWRGAQMNSSLAGFWSHLLDPGHQGVEPVALSPEAAKIATAISALVVTAAAGWLAWKAETPGERDRAFGAAVVAMILCSPTAWDHYWVMLVLPLSILWFTSLADAASYGRGVGALFFRGTFWLIVVLLGVVRPLWIWNLTFGVAVCSPLDSLTALAYPTYCLLVLLGMLCWSRDAEALAGAEH